MTPISHLSSFPSISPLNSLEIDQEEDSAKEIRELLNKYHQNIHDAEASLEKAEKLYEEIAGGLRFLRQMSSTP
jgi:hypothetical protein